MRISLLCSLRGGRRPLHPLAIKSFDDFPILGCTRQQIRVIIQSHDAWDSAVQLVAAPQVRENYYLRNFLVGFTALSRDAAGLVSEDVIDSIIAGMGYYRLMMQPCIREAISSNQAML